MANDNPKTEAQKKKAEADFKKHQTTQALSKFVPKILKSWGLYSDSARKGLLHAAEAGKELAVCKASCKTAGIVWQTWCDDQVEANPGQFPVRYWADKLITLSIGWDKVKDELGITSIEAAVLFIRGKGTDQGQPIKNKGNGTRRVQVQRTKLAEALTASNVTIDAEVLKTVLEAIGIKIDLVG